MPSSQEGAVSSFRPSPERGVFINGVIDEQLVSVIAPSILDHRKTPGPISVFINSRGGVIKSAQMIEGLLRTNGLDGEQRGYIAVAVGHAGSAAADILINADYALAYPTSDIHCHGSRYYTRQDDQVTVEAADLYARNLRWDNDIRASRLAEATYRRVLWLYTLMHSHVEKARGETGATDITSFVYFSKRHLSRAAGELATKACQMQNDISALSVYVFSRAKLHERLSLSDMETRVLKRIIDFEARRHKSNPTWSFSAGGMEEIARDFKLLQDYRVSGNPVFDDNAEEFGEYFLTPVDREWLARQPGDEEASAKRRLERVKARMEPFWFYTLFLCRALMDRENPVAPLDAFWLGLIDEVVGEDLPTLRKAKECPPSQPQTPPLPFPDTENPTSPGLS